MISAQQQQQKSFFKELGNTIIHPVNSIIHPFQTTYNLVEPLLQNLQIGEQKGGLKESNTQTDVFGQPLKSSIPKPPPLPNFSGQGKQQQQPLRQEHQFKTFDEGVGIKRDKVFLEQRRTIAKNLAENHLQEIEKAKKEIEIHEKLLLEAEALSKESFVLAQKAKAIEKRKKEESDAALQRELRLEAERAQEHDRAVMLENERAEAEAEALLHEREFQASQELMKKHHLGIQHARAIMKKHELEAEEAMLQERILAFELEHAEVLNVEVTPGPSPSAVEIEVGVKSNVLPEQRVKSSIEAKDIYKKSIIKEEYEQPLAKAAEAQKMIERQESKFVESEQKQLEEKHRIRQNIKP